MSSLQKISTKGIQGIDALNNRKQTNEKEEKEGSYIKWNVSPSDVSRGKLIQKPGWYVLEIAKYVEEQSKKGDSTNAVFDFRVISDDPASNGIEIRVWFNEKAPGIAVPFMVALGAEEKEDGSLSVDFGKHLEGRRLQGFIKRGEFDGKPKNEISEYAALS